MNRFIRCVCALLVLTIFLTMPAFAAENANARASSFFKVSSVYLWKISDTQFQVWFDVTALGGMEELGASKIKVQRSTDKVNWETVQTYTKDEYANMICKNTCQHADCVTYTYTDGYYYRAYVLLYAKNSSGTGEYGCYTSYLDLR